MANNQSKKIISLWGMPGSGKSHWAKILAEKISFEARDLDALIEMQEGRSIRRIFEEDGEAYFRNIESKILEKTLLKENNLVLSTGGGSPCYNNNLKLLREKTFSIWLNPGIETLVKHLQKGIDKRPLFNQNMSIEEQTRDLLKKRTPIYKKADRVIDQPLSIHLLLKSLPEDFRN